MDGRKRVRIKPLEWFKEECKQTTVGYAIPKGITMVHLDMTAHCSQTTEIIRDMVDSFKLECDGGNWLWEHYMFEVL